MMLFCFSSMIISISLALLNSFTPLALGFWVMMLSLAIALTTSMSCFSWFGFMIFLIYIGGMLVMFAYFVAIQPNQQFDIMISLGSIALTSLLMMGLYPLLDLSHQWADTPTWLTAMLNQPNLTVLMMLALTLFLALLSVVKISSAFMGPLRPFVYV